MLGHNIGLSSEVVDFLVSISEDERAGNSEFWAKLVKLMSG